MKTLINILLPVLAFFSFNSKSQAQCFYFEDFSNPSGWTQVGTLVEINNGELQYIDGAPDGYPNGIQRRVYKQIGTQINSSDNWTASFKFRPDDLGYYQGEDHTGHFIFALTENTQDPWWNCPNLSCTGFPPGIQDAITISYFTDNSPNGNIHFRVGVKSDGDDYFSSNLTYNILGSTVYVQLEKNNNQFVLNIYSDPSYNNPVGNGPVFLDVVDFNSLNYIQHANMVGGYYLRELTGIVDDVCIAFNEENCETTYGSFTYQGCLDDGSSFTIGNNVYDQYNPTGIEILVNEAGCDSIVTIDLTYNYTSEYELVYFGCQGDGFEVEVNGTLYSENNPYGEEYLFNVYGCDSIVSILLFFDPPEYEEINYIGCQGDGYEVTVNGILYWEGNPTGEEFVESEFGCGTIVTINLVYTPHVVNAINYNGCQGDGFEVEVNGTTYWESNPVGEELMFTQYGCDSIIYINLQFSSVLTEEINYVGCQGDGYQIEVNGTTYWEGYPQGEEILVSQAGCDSMVIINLVFNPPVSVDVNYVGCEGDGYQIEVNGTTYWEGNPSGVENLETQYGCDSVVFVFLVFHDAPVEQITYQGCVGDGYSIMVNGTLYNENNPVGTEFISSGIGCDSTIHVDLAFGEISNENINYLGCEGDGFEIEVNGNLYNEENPTGIEIFESIEGCDSLVFINLVFQEITNSSINYFGCKGDGYSFSINGNTYNESNMNGIEILQNANGCDSLVSINLLFAESFIDTISYNGVEGDGYEIMVNGNVYNESNPKGVELIESTSGCDSIIYIFLVFTPKTKTKDEFEGFTGFQLYPIPTFDIINIRMNSFDPYSDKLYKIRIFSPLGIVSETIVPSFIEYSLREIEHLTPGIYYCEVLIENGYSFGLRKFVITR